MMCSIPNTGIYIEIKNQLQIPLEYTVKIIKESKDRCWGNMATTKGTARTNQNVRDVDRLNMTIINAKMKQNVQIVMAIIQHM